MCKHKCAVSPNIAKPTRSNRLSALAYQRFSISPNICSYPLRSSQQKHFGCKLCSEIQKVTPTFAAEDGVHGLPLPHVLPLLLVNVLEHVVNLVDDLTQRNLNVVHAGAQTATNIQVSLRHVQVFLKHVQVSLKHIQVSQKHV